jgi:hypothetical protein
MRRARDRPTGLDLASLCLSTDMVADLLTKPLARPQYSKLRGMMNIMSFDHGEVLNLCIDDSGDSNDQR